MGTHEKETFQHYIDGQIYVSILVYPENGKYSALIADSPEVPVSGGLTRSRFPDYRTDLADREAAITWATDRVRAEFPKHRCSLPQCGKDALAWIKD